MTEGASSHPDGFSRHFVDVAGREVHYLCAGSGPLAVLLPAFPWSVGSLAPLAEALVDDFTVLVMDLPGYGNSDGLDGSPTLDGYADAVAGTLDALDIDRCHLYGLHTGAQLALEVAIRHPARVSNLVLDGLPLMGDAQRKDLAENFCPRFTPSWDGAHLAAIWWWCREQSLFAPWYLPSAATRLDADEPAPGVLHRRAADVLRAGPDYGAGLQAAFARSAARSLGQAAVPLTLVTGAADPFAPHDARIPAPGAQGQVVDLSPAPDRQRQLRSLIGGRSGADRSLRTRRRRPLRAQSIGATSRPGTANC